MKMWMDAHRDAFVRVTPPRVASRAHLHFSKRKIERSRTSIERRAMSTPSQTPLHPRIKWCERADKVYLTIELPDARDVEVTIDAETFAFSAKDASGRAYAETLRLYKPVKKDESTYATTERQVFCALVKEDADWWERLLAAGEKKPANLHVDFDKWADEDDDAGDVDTSMFDMQSMMGGGGMGGGGAGGGGGMRIRLDDGRHGRRRAGRWCAGRAGHGEASGTDSDHENGGSREETGVHVGTGRGGSGRR